MKSTTTNLLGGRKRPLAELSWLERLRYAPEFLGYPVSAFVIVLVLVLLMTLTEGAGVALVYPIIEMMQSGGEVTAVAERSIVFRTTADVLAYIGIPMTFEALVATAAVVILLRQVLNYLTASAKAFFNYRAVERIASRTFRLFLEAEITYAENHRSGSMINAILTEAKRAGTLAAAAQNLLFCASRIAIYVGLLLVLSWQATLCGLGLLSVVTLFFSRRSVRSAMQTGRRIAQANDSLTRYAVERFGLILLSKVSNAVEKEADDFAGRAASLRRMNVQVNRQAARLNAVVEGAMVLGGLALVYGAIVLFAMPLPALAVFLVAILRLMPVAQEIAVNVQHLSVSSSGVRYIDTLNLEAAALREIDNGERPFPKLKSGIRFEKVSFQYEPSSDDSRPIPALRDVTTTIPAGKTTALVGPSGAGKTTLLDLIPRLRWPESGRVLFDDIPTDDIRLTDLRSAVSMVSQETLVIDGTIEENIRYGSSGKTKAQVEAAANAAYAHEFVDALPKGYATMVGERGVMLSGGQKQRLALARALLANSKVLLLDEPTSALDAESELAVQKALARLQTDGTITVVIIAHRLSTVRHADNIVVLDQGRLLGTGTHAQLMKSALWYRRVVELQLGVDEKKKSPARRKRPARSKTKTAKKVTT